MLRTFTYQIEPEDAGMTVLQYLTAHGYSHTIITHLKKTPYGILLNDTWAYVASQLSAKDTLVIRLLESGSPELASAPIPLSVCYEDEDILIVDKPCNMPVHPSKLHQNDTLANAVCGYYKAQKTSCPFRCINRIDRDTTGLVLLAKNMLSAALLGNAMRKHEIHREYLTIVQGTLPESGTIDAPISRIAPSCIKRQVDFLHGESAVTHYRCLARHNGLSLAAVWLETGRTHQIRVHMSHLGYPLLGDTLYGKIPNEQLKRQALHSCRLYFNHPITGLPLDFSAPLPADMAAFFPQVPYSHRECVPSEVPFG